MPPLKQILLVLASISLPLVAMAPVRAAAAPGPEDVAAVRNYIARNRAYTPAGRAEALRRLALLPGLTGDPARFELEVAHIAALSDNGHSALLPPQWASRYKRSPVRLGLFADGLYVVATLPDRRRLLGRKLLRINGHDWREIRAAYARYQGGEPGFRDQFVTLFMELPALLVAAGFGTDPELVEYSLAPRRRGPPEQVLVAAALSPYPAEAAFTGTPMLIEAAAMLPPAARPLYLREPGESFRLAFLPRIDAAFVQLKATGGLHIDAFLESTLAELRARRPRNIIVDLRFNMGGNLNITRAFMQALPGLAQGGRIYAITSGRTFSAAISSLGYLRQAAGDRLVIVGEPIGDRLEFWAEGDIMRLPGLDGMMLYATERHNYMTGCPQADCHASIRDHPIRVTGLQPDIATPLLYADFRAGRDPAMEAIARDARRLPYAPMLGR
ncbi:MAG: hypothetical protein QOD42_1231 [Sphingomonadales bacterium]|jgi:hypothetical protein|nr:hypothetical protein [Sphingomonadales bacterium]